MTTHIRVHHSMKFALDLNTGSRNLSRVNSIDTLIGRCACAAWSNSAYSAGSQWHCAAGLTEVDTHLSGTDSGAACVNAPFGAVYRCRPNVNSLHWCNGCGVGTSINSSTSCCSKIKIAVFTNDVIW